MNYAYTEQMMRETLKLKPGSRITFLQPEGKGKEYHIQKIRGKVIKTYPYYVLVEIENKKGKYRECFLNKDIFLGLIRTGGNHVRNIRRNGNSGGN